MKLLKNSNIMLIIGILLAFILPEVAVKLKFLLTSVLVVMLTLSLKDVSFKKITKSKYLFAIKLMLMNYLFLPIFIFFAMLFITDPAYKIGFVILAAVPPAIGIIPLAFLYKINIKIMTVAQILSYLVAFILLPSILFIFLKEIFDMTLVIESLFLFLFLPLALSRFINPLKNNIFKYNKLVVNLLYSFLFFLVIGSNYKIILNDFNNIIYLFVIMLLLSFGLGTLIFIINKQRKTNLSQNSLYILFGTFKNTAMGAVLAILIFNDKAALPLIIRTMITPFYILYLNFLFNIAYKK